MSERIAVVAGVGAGIGARFVETFAQEGYRVAALARNQQSLDRIRDGLGSPGRAMRVLGDRYYRPRPGRSDL